jgi:tetratricopeptide (TPR) repeat protein
MKQEYKENVYSIAWFKIAEYVMRGEKERALGVYRLLSHSLDDQPLAFQLEADILMACGDDRAPSAYIKAGEQYEKENRRAQAIAVYEHVATIQPGNESIQLTLIRLYGQENNQERLYEHANHLIHLYFDNRNYHSACNLVESISTLPVEKIVDLGKQILYASSARKNDGSQGAALQVLSHLVRIINTLQPSLMPQFLNDLQINSEMWYHKALELTKAQ